MTALAQNCPPSWHPFPAPTRRWNSPLKILAGMHLFSGAIAMAHNDRLMPAAPLNNASTPTLGGPLQIAGADVNGGLRLIAKAPNVYVSLTIVGTTATATASISYYIPGGRVVVVITAGNIATAAIVVSALMGNAEVRSFIDATYTGTGASVVAGVGSTAVPFVRLLGAMETEHDNSANSSDLVVSGPIIIKPGIYRVANDATDPASAADIGGEVVMLDDQTIARTAQPLMLRVPLYDWDATLGPFIQIR